MYLRSREEIPVYVANHSGEVNRVTEKVGNEGDDCADNGVNVCVDSS